MRLAILLYIAMIARVAEAAPKAQAQAKKPVPRWQTLELPPAMPKANDTGFVESGGAQIYYARYGNTKGAPVILLHGGMGNSDHWSHQVPALAAKLHVIAIDSRGQGRSTRPKNANKSKPSYDVMADDVLAVMDHLGLERASLVGWSDGGEIALKLAIHHPERVDKLFVIGANYDTKGAKPHSGKPSRTFGIYSSKCRADYARLSKTPKQYSEVSSWLAPIWRTPMGFTKEQLRSIKAKTIVADGEHDEIIELDQIKEMAKLIPNARVEVFADTSHFAIWQDPASVNTVLLAFLAP